MDRLQILKDIDFSDYGMRGETAKEILIKIWSGEVSSSMSNAEYYSSEIDALIARVKSAKRKMANAK